MPQFDSYIICTAPRSGSTLLCGLLASTGQSGNPDSHFHAPSVAGWCEDFGLDPIRFATEGDLLRAVLDAALTEGRGGTPLFGLRLQQHSLGFLMQQLARLFPDAPSDLARMQAAFGKTLFLHLSREDKISQAISFVRASQTGLWHRAPDGEELERLAPPASPVYDENQIAQARADLTAQDVAWGQWFAAQGITPLRLQYEALSVDPKGAVGAILSALGVPEAQALAQTIRPTVSKLSDAISRDWNSRFRARPA